MSSQFPTYRPCPASPPILEVGLSVSMTPISQPISNERASDHLVVQNSLIAFRSREETSSNISPI